MLPSLIAAVDIGTHSVKMTLASRSTVLGDWVEVTRLGENLSATGTLDPGARERTLAALRRFAGIVAEHGGATWGVVGTSALRDARDGAAFARAAEQCLGAPIAILTGDREAQLVFRAIADDPEFPLGNQDSWVVSDVGGGSTELVVGVGETALARRSLDLGAVRLTDALELGGDEPVGDVLLAEAQAAVDTLLQREFPRTRCGTLVASGGTATNLAAMALGEFDASRVHGFALDTTGLEDTVRTLARLSLAERRRIPGLDPQRAPVMVAGALIQWRVAVHFGCSEIRVSVRGLRYGLIAELRSHLG